MASNKHKTFLFLIALLIGCGAMAQLPKNIILIGNDLGTTSLNTRQVIDYMKGEKNFWRNGNKVEIVLPSNKSELVDEVAVFVYKTSSVGMQKYWLARVFQGRNLTPTFLASDEEVINFVKKTKGSIGFIRPVSKSQASDYILEVLPD